MRIRTVVQFFLIAFVVWWVIEQPGNAGHLVNDVGHLFSNPVAGITHFIHSI